MDILSKALIVCLTGGLALLFPSFWKTKRRRTVIEHHYYTHKR